MVSYPVHSLIQNLLASDVQENRVCKVQPLGVTKNAVFQIDLDCVAFEDLKADGLGSWVTTGTTFGSLILMQFNIPLAYQLQVNVFC